jgi:hypothetical protein
MALLIKHSNASNLIRFTLKNSSTGVGLTGLAYNTSGLIISTIADNEATATIYTAAASNIETIATLGTFATPTTNKCRFKEVDATNHKGLYEFQFADARFAVSSARKIIISVTGATSLLDADYEIQLVSFDPHDSVRAGLTALPTATLAELAQGIPPTTPTLSEAIMLLYMKLRNQSLTTASELGIYNDAGTKITKAALSDDGSTFTKGKLASGA